MSKTKIIPIGGLDEVGKNMMIFEEGNDIIIVDCGFEFPSDTLPGIDYIVPDCSYLEKNKHKIKGIIITHGHLDHIGALRYIMKRIGNPPIFTTLISKGFIENQLGVNKVKINVIKDKQKIKLGCFTFEFFRVNHSIPNPMGVFITSPNGKFVHTGDFKFDLTPSIDPVADFEKISSFAKENVTILFSDSTNALKPGHTISEKVIGENLEKLIAEASGRVIIGTFSSLIGRIQDIINAAKKHHKQVYISGRSMVNNVGMANKYGYLKYPKNLVHGVEKSKNSGSKNSVIITTGAQGEEMAALSKMARGEHKNITIKKSDTIILSSSPIPGNERAFFNIVNKLSKLGAKVVNHKDMDIHTSGHAQQEELLLMLEMVKSNYFVPVHGEWFMRKAHSNLALEVGYDPEKCLMIENGYALEVVNGKVKMVKDAVGTDYMLIDGKGIGRMNSDVIKDRKEMNKSGIVTVVAKIDKTHRVNDLLIETAGVLYKDEENEMLKKMNKKTKYIINTFFKTNKGEKYDSSLKNYLKRHLRDYIRKEIGRTPIIQLIIIKL